MIKKQNKQAKAFRGEGSGCRSSESMALRLEGRKYMEELMFEEILGEIKMRFVEGKTGTHGRKC